LKVVCNILATYLHLRLPEVKEEDISALLEMAQSLPTHDPDVLQGPTDEEPLVLKVGSVNSYLKVIGELFGELFES